MATGASSFSGKPEAADGRLPAGFALGAAVYLLLVVLVGVLLRARYVADFWPGMVFGNLVHAHSHAAYFGWASLALMAGILRVLPWLTGRPPAAPEVVRAQLWLTGAATLGAFAAFAAGGYNPVSIAFSTLNVLLWYVFAGLFRASLRGLPRPWPVPLQYFAAAVAFLLLSSLGTWLVTAVTVLGVESPLWRAAGLYLFLNSFADGWLLLGVLGLLLVVPAVGARRAAGAGGREAPAASGAWAAGWLPWLVVATLPAFLAYLIPYDAPPLVVALGLAARGLQGVVYGSFLVQVLRGLAGLVLPAAARRLLIAAAGFLAVKALVHAATGLGWAAGSPVLHRILAEPPRQLFVAYLHADLLGAVTCGLLGLLYVLFGPWCTSSLEGHGHGQTGRCAEAGAAVLGAGVAGMVAALAGAGAVEGGFWPGPAGPALVGAFRTALAFSVAALMGVVLTVIPLVRGLTGHWRAGRAESDESGGSNEPGGHGHRAAADWAQPPPSR